MRKSTVLLFGFLVSFVFSVHAQIGGRHAYSFLEQPISARLAALGGNQASIDDNDLNVGYVNPSMINPAMNNNLILNYVNFFEGINYASVNYANTFKKSGSFMGTIQYMDYGKFDYADEAGNLSGSFGASDLAVVVGWGRQLDSLFSIGASAKLIYSFYESYNSFGFAVDVAGTYQSKTGWTMSLIGSNLGMQLTTYTPGERNPLPFNLQYAISKKLEHVPFRFSVIYDHIEKWDLTYDDPANPAGTVDPITGEVKKPSWISTFGDQLIRHFIVGGEVFIGKNLVLRAGYNFRRRAEMKMVSKPGMVGFSWGFGIRISKFKLNYARSAYHLVGSPNYLTLSVDIDAFKNKSAVRF